MYWLKLTAKAFQKLQSRGVYRETPLKLKANMVVVCCQSLPNIARNILIIYRWMVECRLVWIFYASHIRIWSGFPYVQLVSHFVVFFALRSRDIDRHELYGSTTHFVEALVALNEVQKRLYPFRLMSWMIFSWLFCSRQQFRWSRCGHW